MIGSKRSDKFNGFTLIELVIVIILLGVLAATITPRFQNIQDDARQAVVDAAVGAVKSAALISFAANQGVAVTGATVEGQVDFDGSVQFNGGTAREAYVQLGHGGRANNNNAHRGSITIAASNSIVEGSMFCASTPSSARRRLASW